MSSEAGALRLQPLELWFQPVAGPLLPQVLAALREQACRGGVEGEGRFAEPLRWAITAVEAGRGIHLEGILLIGPPASPARPPGWPWPVERG